MLTELYKLIKKGSILSIGQIGTAALQFLLLPVYTRILNVEDFGKLELLTIYSSILCILIILGMRQAFTRNYLIKNHKKSDKKFHENQKQVTVSTITFIFFWGSFLVLVSYFFSNNLSLYLFESSKNSDLITLCSIWALGLAFSQMYHAYLINNERLKLYVIITFIQLLTNLSFSIYLLIVKQYGVHGIIISNTITNFAFGFISNIWIYVINRSSFSYTWLIKLLKFGVPSMFAILILTSFDMIDRLFLNHYLGLKQLGIYSIGKKIVFIVSIMLTGPFMSLWTPYSYKIANEDNHKKTISNLLPKIVFLFSFFSLSISYFAPFIIMIVATSEYYQASEVIIWLAMCQTSFAISTVFTTGINISNKPKLGMYINLVVLFFGLIANYIFIPIYGFVGASISTFFTFAFQAILIFISAQKLYKIPYNPLKIIVPILATFLFYNIGLWADHLSSTLMGQLSIRFLLLGIYIPTVLLYVFDSQDMDLLKNYFKLNRKWLKN